MSCDKLLQKDARGGMLAISITEDRRVTVAQIAALEQIELKAGSHDSPDDGMCVMEAVAYFAGEPFSDHPQCVSPVISAFMRSWNDSLDDSSRQRLKAYVFKVMNTNNAADDERRAWLATDWLVRTYTPTWLDLAGLNDYATALRECPELSTDELAEQAQETIEVALRATAAAAWDAAWDAAAWDNAAGDAAWATARTTAMNAAMDAGRTTAMNAAMDAGRSALQPTVEALQTSAFDLLDRMIAVGRLQ